MEAIVVAAIGPLLTAGLAALGVVLSRRLHEHDLNTRHERAVARATAQITALKHLLRVYEAAAEPAERETVRRQVLAGLEQARADLEHAYAALRGGRRRHHATRRDDRPPRGAAARGGGADAAPQAGHVAGTDLGHRLLPLARVAPPVARRGHALRRHHRCHGGPVYVVPQPDGHVGRDLHALSGDRSGTAVGPVSGLPGVLGQARDDPPVSRRTSS